MAVWLTSDTHFGHANICRGVSNWEDKASCRDFDTIEDHDAYLLEQINNRVRACDQLWIVGDFGFGHGKKERFPALREAIKCEDVRLVLGNHDHAFEREDSPLRVLFKRVKLLHYGKIAGRHMCLCHYAMRTWPWQQFKSVHAYGHSHGNLPDDPKALSLDIGVDTVLFGHEKYTPYSTDELFHIMDTQKTWSPVDHHVEGVDP